MVYINGVNGKIGRYLHEYFSKRMPVTRVSSTSSRAEDIFCDLQNPDLTFCHRMSPGDFFLFFGAMATSRAALIDPGLTRKINVEGTASVIRAALEKGVRVIFCSTTCVYGMGGREPFEEQGVLNTDKTYAKVKIEIENMFSDDPHFKVVRPSNVISGNVSFIDYLRNCVRANETAVVYSGWHFNPIAVQDVAAITYEIVQRWDEAPKVMNLCGMEYISKEKIAEIYKAYVDQELSFVVIPPPAEYLKEVDFYNPCSTKLLTSFYKMPLMSMQDAIIAEQYLAR